MIKKQEKKLLNLLKIKEKINEATALWMQPKAKLKEQRV